MQSSSYFDTVSFFMLRIFWYNFSSVKGGFKFQVGALKTQEQHFVGENVAWEKLQTIEY